jgi:1-acyl-sn-glycerol-3-phosphate acyltransferase
MAEPTVKPGRAPVDHMAGRMQGVAFTVIRIVLLLLCRVLLRMKIEGLQHVPMKGGVLVVSNHLHNADPVLISVAMPRPVHYMAKKELMGIPVIGRVIRYGGAFAVDRGKADRQAIVQATERLQQGIAVGMFPEGTRSVSRHIERVLPGAGLIALRGDVPILPAAIVGSERLPLNGDKQMHDDARGRWRVTVTFGEPFRLEPTSGGKRMSPDEAINLAMTRVAALLPESYRGIYANTTDQPPT